MEDMIELYLFKNKICPLPSVGVLQVIDTHAIALYSEGKIEAPVPAVKLFEEPTPADDFIEFIAFKKNISASEASGLLTRYCNRLQNMDAFGETKLPHTGKFYVNADGNLVFKTMEIPGVFLQQVRAERVVHPDASHAMVVGDKETTTTEMAAYYSESEAKSKDRWWIWATGLAVVTATLLVLYFKDQDHFSGIGNTQKIEIPAVSNTYSIAE